MHARIPFPFVFALALIGAPSQASPLLHLTPTSQTVDLGGSVNVELGIAELDSGTALGGYDVTVGFDAALLNFRGIRFGDPLLGDQLDLDHSGNNDPSAVMLAPGRLDLLEVSLDSASRLYQQQAGEFVLATLLFDSRTTGRSAITLAVNDLADPSGNRFDANIENADVAIVPVPATAILLACGLWPWLVAIRCRRSAHV